MSNGLRPSGPARHRRDTGPDGESICRPSETDEFFSPENVRILESWNAAGDPDLSIARARLAPGESTRNHCLVGITERYLIVQGSGIVHIGSLPATEVRPGDVVFIPPGVPQRATSTGRIDLVFYCLCTPAFDESRYRTVAGSVGEPGGG